VDPVAGIPRYMLDKGEARRRIVAARELQGLKQAELGRRFKDDGLGQEDPARIERGEKPMQAVHRHAFARHLGVPEEWFLLPLDQLLAAITDGIKGREVFPAPPDGPLQPERPPSPTARDQSEPESDGEDQQRPPA
jgi:transcriptional regulator with XRE-family HTH domain